jgi:formylglycine-generating enzyme required for sulfatase activity
LLAELLVSGPQAYRALFPSVEQHAAKALPVILAELDTTATLSSNKPVTDKDRLAERQARAAVALVQLKRGEAAWPLLRHSADPRLRSFMVNWMKPMGVDPKVIVAEFDHIDAGVQPKPVPGSQTMDAILFDSETSVRRALIQALGTYDAEGLSSSERERLMKKLLDLYRDDPDAGIHGAAEWTLRRWKQQETLKPIDVQLRKDKDRGDRRWYVNGQGQTFAVIDRPLEFHMGSPESDPERVATGEPEYQVTIPRHFAIATKEVTMSQFRAALETDDRFKVDVGTEQEVKHYSPDPDGPWIGPSWYTAAAYCNWLSKQEDLPENQWCYQPKKDGSYAEGMTIPADVLKRTGYRLPTEAEWEYTCRAGTVTSRYYGVSISILEKYAWYLQNGRERAWPVGSLLPNDLGLFDMLGNVYEWCQDGKDVRPENKAIYIDVITKDESVVDKRVRILRGGMYTVLSREVRSAHRSADLPTYESIFTGFRVARTLP